MNKDTMFTESLFDKETEKYIKEHKSLMKQVMHEVTVHESYITERITKEDPFVKERLFIEGIKKNNNISNQIQEIKDEYKNIVNVPLHFDFYVSEFEKNKKISNVKQKRNRNTSIARSLIKEMQENLLKREITWKKQLIDEERKKYLKNLCEQINRFKKLERLLAPFIGRTGLLWDMSSSFFQDSGFEILEIYADLLERDESLRELASILGRHARAQREYEKEFIEKIVINTEWKPRPALKGQIAGLCTSNDISSVLPSELALFRNPATKKLFEKKFAEKSLLSFKYENEMPQEKTEFVQEEVSKKGPIIICVDTSGSMHGTPENIAKTITFALAKVAIEEDRKCYLISFSKRIETLDLTEKNGNSIASLVSFLRMSFYGGTDATPALLHSINLLQQNEWENADVLMVSDFVMNNFSEQTTTAINTQKEKKTKFYSLVIGQSGNANAIECFNHNWSYNMYDPNASRRLVEQIHEIQNRNSE